MEAPATIPRVPLSPLQYFRRASEVYRDRVAVIDADLRLTGKVQEYLPRAARENPPPRPA
jgi:hypothetical protein